MTRYIKLSAETYARLNYALADASDARRSEINATRDSEIITSNESAIAANNVAADQLTQAWNAGNRLPTQCATLEAEKETRERMPGERTNRDRSNRAADALRKYNGSDSREDGVEGDSEMLADMLGDLRHWARLRGVDFDACAARGFAMSEMERVEDFDEEEEEDEENPQRRALREMIRLASSLRAAKNERDRKQWRESLFAFTETARDTL